MLEYTPTAECIGRLEQDKTSSPPSANVEQKSALRRFEKNKM